jgi:putative ABC transport system substrate-binding protein
MNPKSKTCTEPFDFAQHKLRRSIQNRKWRGILATLALIVGCVGIAEAQQQAKMPRIGLLSPFSPSVTALWHQAFRQGLRDLGYVEGQNIILEYRYAENRYDRLPDLAVELVSLKVAAIVTVSTPAVQAAKQATSTIPIVFAAISDPVGDGFVASFARPGGNITGLTVLAPELSGKRLDLLKEAFPRVWRVAVLSNPTNASHVLILKETETAARTLGLSLQSVRVQRPNDLEGAFSSMAHERASALVVLPDPFLASQRTQIIDLAAKNHLPVMYDRREYVDNGGLMSYGPSFPYQFQRAAIYVDKILKGTKPANLPVEQPTKFELVINLKAAKQIGVTIPPNVLARADRVIK